MNEKILIFGNGQIGNFYQNYFTEKGLPCRIAQADITHISQIEAEIANFNPTVVINTAAITNLEQCSADKLNSFNVNVLGADNIARICDEKNIYLIHFSSGCIFQSQNETDIKKEEDIPQPAAYYSWTKIWAENLIQFNKSKSFKYLILRPRQPISGEVNHKNMLIKMLTFINFVDTPNTGTVIEDLMGWTFALIAQKYTGVLHVANSGWSTPYRIGLLLKKHILPSLEVNKISKEELDKTTPNRRVDTILDVSKLESLGIKVPSYEHRLEEIIMKLAKNIQTMKKPQLAQVLETTLEASKQRTFVNSCWQDLIKN
ncbi:MAG: SDR family oxidoreductase [Patescibacteria group bacterium]